MTRIVWFHPRPLLPLDHGGNIRTHGLVRLAALAGHEVLLVMPGGGPAVLLDGVTALELAGRRGLGRMLAKVASRYPLRSPRVRWSARRNARRVVARFSPEIAIVSEAMAWSLASGLVPADTPLVYDAHNVETALFRGLVDRSRGWFDRTTTTIDLHRIARVERALLARASAVLVVSEADRETFASDAPGADLWLVPSSVATPDPATPAESGPTCLFVGTLDYPPNRDAVEALVTRIWPEVVRDLPDARLQIVGRRPPPDLRAAVAACPGAELLDEVVDLAPVYARSRCVVIPIRSGGGSRLKVYEALAHGVPIVATAFAMSGVASGHAGARIAESAADLAAEVRALLRDDEQVEQLGAAGRAAFVEDLAWDRAPRAALLAAIASAAGSDRA